MTVIYRTYLKCACGQHAIQVMDSNLINDYKCDCGQLMKWHRLVVTRNMHEDKSSTLTIIPPMHSYIEIGMKGGPKEINRRSELKEYAKEYGKILASKEEIAQEADHHKRQNEREYASSSRERIVESLNRLNYLREHS